MTDRPDTCPNCGDDYTLDKPDSYSRMCYVGTLDDTYPGWEFYHA